MAMIGFIGLGNMGAPMAANLVKAGHRVTGFDVVSKAVERLAAQGGAAATSAAEATTAGDIVITRLPSGPEVRSADVAPDGNGQAAKICNNMMLGVSMIAVCEAFSLAERLGLAAQTLFDISAKSSGQCWALTSYCPVPGPVPASPANRDYAPGFTAAMMLKDLRLAQQAAGAAAAATPLGAVAANLYQLLVDGGA